MKMNSFTGTRGFTLFEVLVALAVMAFGIAALWKGLTQSINVSTALPDRIAARWVAQNRLILRQARSEWPQPRTYQGVMNMGDRRWYWKEDIEASEDPLLRKITVRVSAEDKKSPSLFSMEGFLTRPRPPRRVSGATQQQATAGQSAGAAGENERLSSDDFEP